MLILQLFQNPLYFAAFLTALILGITVHEFAHAWVAYHSGDPTPKVEGRLTLNPFAHLDPIGTIFLFLVGFGWGKPVSTNPNYFHHKSDELKVAFAGIAMNIILAIIVSIPVRIALLSGHLIESSPTLVFLEIIAEMNIVLAAFNILPIPPLDGSHLVEYFLGDEAKITFQTFGPYLLIGLLIFDRFGNTSILFTVMEPIIRFLAFATKGSSVMLLLGS